MLLLSPTSYLIALLAVYYCNALTILNQARVAKTNAERFAAGLPPAAPRAISKYLTRQQVSHVRANGRRQEPSALPFLFPPHPDTSNLPLVHQSDDGGTQFALPFSAEIFGNSGSSLFLASNGFLSITDGEIDAFAQDLDTRGSGYGIFAATDATSVTVRWKAPDFDGADVGEMDFTVYYTTTRPGIWFIYYDAYSGTGDGSDAEVNAATFNPANYLQFSSNTAFRTPNDGGLVIALDTAKNVVRRKA